MNSYHYRCVRNATGSCVDTSLNAELIVNSTTGINSIAQENLVISPNPANTFVIIKSGELISKIEITNLIGQKVFTEQCSTNKLTINISTFEMGLYLIKVNDFYIQKLIKE